MYSWRLRRTVVTQAVYRMPNPSHYIYQSWLSVGSSLDDIAILLRFHWHCDKIVGYIVRMSLAGAYDRLQAS